MTTIRRYGTPLVRQPNGVYLTEDGRYEVACQEYDTWCDEPHPVKLPRDKWELTGEFDSRGRWVKRMKKGYFCEGGAEHGYKKWHIYDIPAEEYAFGDGPGEYDTFKEAAEALTRNLAKEKVTP